LKKQAAQKEGNYHNVSGFSQEVSQSTAITVHNEIDIGIFNNVLT
jgi:hypothetical protein